MFNTLAHHTLDTLLARWQPDLGEQFTAYGNHCRRLLVFCQALQPALSEDDQRKLGIAAAFHDLGLWTHDTLDYLPPSQQLAAAYLDEQGLADWQTDIDRMISEHHKLRADDQAHQPLVEIFRQADLVDFSWGLYRAGLPRALVRTVQAACPDAGFHAFLLRRGLGWLGRHPLNPLPMMKW